MKPLILGTAGLQINIPIEKFPYEYRSIMFLDDKAAMDVAGVGYSHCLIFGGLGDSPTFLTGIGNDMFAPLIEQAVAKTGAECIVDKKDKETLVSVILYDDSGKRSIIREGRMDYKYKMNPETYRNLADDFDVAVFSMSGFSKELLPVMKSKNIPIACDIQTTDNLFNDYGRDFMEYSDIIFFSSDHYDGDLVKLAEQLYDKHGFKIICIGMGDKGCLLCAEGQCTQYDAEEINVVNTVGAGDALFGSFIHCYFNGDDTKTAILKAQIFAAEKIRYDTASKGFMSKGELEKKYRERYCKN